MRLDRREWGLEGCEEVMGERDLTAWATGKLVAISAAGGIRRCHPYAVWENDPVQLSEAGRPLINFGSNDYLGLSQSPLVRAAATAEIGDSGTAVGASRVLTGTRYVHQELETALGSWLDKESVLLFGAGYLANLGVIATVVGRHDAVVADRLVHASILDGIALSGAKLLRYAHNSVDDLRAKVKRVAGLRTFIITESVFSMDGDVAPLADIVSIAAEAGALVIVDEAHAIGVFGDGGAGALSGSLRGETAVITGTLSKACGSYGGFAAGSAELCNLLRSSARSFLFNTGLPAASAAAAVKAIEIIRGSKAARDALLLKAAQLRAKLQSEGFATGDSASQIIPVILGSNEAVVRASDALKRCGVLVPAIRPPTVAPGTARLRISLTSGHTEDQIDLLVRTLCAHRDGVC